MRKVLFATFGVAAAVVLQAGQVLACGGLVAPDGDVRLAKATTFVAWSGGIEHYVTSFAFTGAVTDVGWIVPLPAIPTSITEAARGHSSAWNANLPRPSCSRRSRDLQSLHQERRRLR